MRTNIAKYNSQFQIFEPFYWAILKYVPKICGFSCKIYDGEFVISQGVISKIIVGI